MDGGSLSSALEPESPSLPGIGSLPTALRRLPDLEHVRLRHSHCRLPVGVDASLRLMRSRLVCFKHITYALVTLVLSVCGAEVGLRVYDSYTGELSAPRDQDAGLCARCWWMHHRLKPLVAATEINPDTGSRVEIKTNSNGLRSDE